MDPITHTLVGAALGEGGLKHRTPLGMAALVIGANLPDVDVASYAAGNVAALAFRRGWTHGPLAMIALPLLLVATLLAWERLARRRSSPDVPRTRPAQLLLLSAIAVWSHPLLDWLNTYGVRLLMPFSERWFYGDTLFIVDPWLWMLFGVGVVFGRWKGPRVPRFALAAALGYVASMWLASAAARSAITQMARTALPEPIVSVMAAPVPVNPFVRRIVVETDAAYHYGEVRWVPPTRASLAARGVAKRADLLRVAVAAPDGRSFLRWSRFPIAVPEDGLVQLRDARYPGSGGAWAGVMVPIVADSP